MKQLLPTTLCVLLVAGTVGRESGQDSPRTTREAQDATIPSPVASWTIPQASEPLQIRVQGKVEIVRSSIQDMRPGSPGAMVVWRCPDGMQAEYGDELFRMDCTELQNRYYQLGSEIASGRQSLITTRLQAEKELFQMKEDLALELLMLGVARANAAAAAAADDNELGISRQRIESAKRNVDVQESELKRKKNLLKLGQEKRVTVEDLELTLAATRRAIRVRELELEDIGDGSDEVVARRAKWDVARLESTFGEDIDFETLQKELENEEIIEFRKNMEAELDSIKTDLEAREVEFQQLARGGWPHVPLEQLSVSNDTGPLHSIVPGTPEATAVYDASRGSGWLEAPATYPSTNALVIQGMASWKCDLPPGRYRVNFVVGDDNEWGCMVVKAAEKILLAVHRLEPGQGKTHSAEVVVEKDGLQLDFGLPQKAIVAPASCVIKNQHWLRLGHKIDVNPPALYIIPSPKLVAKLHIHHLQIPFFEETDGATRRIELRNSNGEWVPGGEVNINDQPVVYFKSDPDGLYRKRHQDDDESTVDPAERTAREVSIAVPDEQANGFVSESHVECRAFAVPEQGTMVVPAFLVHEGDDGLVVQRDGQRLPVSGTRFDQHFLLSGGISTGDRLEIPSVDNTEADANRFTGEVVAGAAVPMSARHKSWARVESMVPHGSKVKKGDLVVDLFRNRQYDQYVKSDARAERSKAQYQKTIGKLKNTFKRGKKVHADSVYDEKVAADRVAEHRRRDLAVLASAEDDKRNTDEQLKLIEERVDALSGLESARLEFESYRRQRDILRLQVKQKKLEEIAAFRSSDYTVQLQDSLNWQQSRATLTRREARIALNLKQQALMSQQARNLLEQGLEDRMKSKDFEKHRRLHAPADGHIFYRKGYNDLAKRMERLEEDFVVWQGLTIADILDLSDLSFKISLPETYYDTIRLDLELPIELEDLGDRILTGRVVDKGRVLYPPQKNGRKNKESISLRRVFDVTLSFTVPNNLLGRVKPGLRGAVTLK
ncbi:MAG: hypothetical protein QGH15_07475 [Kiritimatiellia bacterium]|jgi:hypothetical protein|nr:hypothetical protein [Kiritimatiellia bacterium]